MDLKSIDVQGWLDWFAANKDAFEAIDFILGILGILLIVPIIWVIKRFLKWMRSPAPMPKEEAPEATKTDNSQTQNFAPQSGGNAAGRDVNIIHNHTNGEDQERYRQSVERQINDLTNRLERANQDKGALDADKRSLQNEINDLHAKTFDIEASFRAAKDRADNLAVQLTAMTNQVDPEQLSQARGLLAEFDFDGAERILTQIVNDQELNVRQSTAAHYGLGEIAEERVNWQSALEHYKRAYGQDPTPEHQKAYARLCWQMGPFDDAVTLLKDILKEVGAISGSDGQEYAQTLNDLALNLQLCGDFDKAEPLHNDALLMRHRVLGDDHPDTAESLNNLAALYRAQGRYEDAEPLYDEALSITRRVLGADNPDTAGSLNNLAGLYYVQGRYSEAVPLYKEAVEIMERVLEVEHPNTKIVRDNYERLLAEMKEENTVVGSK